ncbi:hypothetical protein ILYODFUR_033461 [Ilyodon furcidens]|uniref:Uncharacterized protein n=1 Tax=Ilyodon furcidens TaxID=33524 RepID=A0ABV0SR85_9TELE
MKSSLEICIKLHIISTVDHQTGWRICAEKQTHLSQTVACGSPGGGPPGIPVLWGAFGCLWLRSPLCLSWVQGGQVCGSSHSLLQIILEKPYKHKRSHTYIHRCSYSCVNRNTDIPYIELRLLQNTSCIH